MKKISLVVVALLVISALSYLAWHTWGPSKPENVVLIAIDTLRADHVSCYGYKDKTTPVLDNLASQGVRFAQCTSQAPWTLPSFSTIFTSLYPSQHGAQINHKLRDLSKDAPRRLQGVVTLTKILKDHGLFTQAYASNPFTGYGIDDDFDQFGWIGGSDSDEWAGNAHEITDGGISFLNSNKRKPFFLYLHYNDVHEHHKIVPPPYTEQFTSKDLLEKLDGRTSAPYELIFPHVGFAMYDARVTFCDNEIGRFIDALKEKGLWDKTLIMILSDHGEEYYDHAKEEEQFGFDPRGFYGIGHGQSLYEELLNVVFILSGGQVPQGKVIQGPSRLLDVMPTVLDLMGIQTNVHMEGVSLKSAMETGRIEDRPVFSEGIAYGYDKKAVRFHEWKYIFSFYNNFEELFNLEKDPKEKHNLINEEKERAKFLRKQLVSFMEKGNEESFSQEGEQQIDNDVKKRLQDLGYLN